MRVDKYCEEKDCVHYDTCILSDGTAFVPTLQPTKSVNLEVICKDKQVPAFVTSIDFNFCDNCCINIHKCKETRKPNLKIQGNTIICFK